MQSFGDTRGLVFRSWGEAPNDVSWLISEAVSSSAGRRSHAADGIGNNHDGLRAFLSAKLSRRWGMTALRANAQLLLDRLDHVSSGASEAAAWRFSSRRRYTLRRNFDAGLSRGPRVWRGDSPDR